MNIVQLTLAARKNTGEMIGVVAKDGKLAIARYTREPRARHLDRELLTEWVSMMHVCKCLEAMPGDFAVR